MAEQQQVTYVCTTCKMALWSYSEVVNHKTFTGHCKYDTNN
jgi:hypothetical protein